MYTDIQIFKSITRPGTRGALPACRPARNWFSLSRESSRSIRRSRVFHRLPERERERLLLLLLLEERPLRERLLRRSPRRAPDLDLNLPPLPALRSSLLGGLLPLPPRGGLLPRGGGGGGPLPPRGGLLPLPPRGGLLPLPPRGGLLPLPPRGGLLPLLGGLLRGGGDGSFVLTFLNSTTILFPSICPPAIFAIQFSASSLFS